MTLISSAMVLYAYYNKVNYCVVKWNPVIFIAVEFSLSCVVCVGVNR